MIWFRLFLFSSRRRHTRCYRDWSSDVCSSDLISALPIKARLNSVFSRPVNSRTMAAIFRSEERRVGKECRSRCLPYHQKNDKLANVVTSDKLVLVLRVILLLSDVRLL